MKRKVLVSVLACAMLFLGMGYAYWTDSLQIDTKVTTGELDVRFVDLALYGQYEGNDNEISWSIIDGVKHGDEDGYVAGLPFGRGTTNYNLIGDKTKIENYRKEISGYATDTTFDAELKNPTKMPITVDCYQEGRDNTSKTIEITLNKIYPGYAQVFQSDIVNVGTIAAKLSDITFNVNAPDKVKDVIGVSLHLYREYATTPDPSEAGKHVNVFPTDLFKPGDTFVLGGVDFIRLSALENNTSLKDYLENELLYVHPDENRMDLYLGIAMDPDYDGEYTSGHAGLANPVGQDWWTENCQYAQFDINLLWDQFNVRAEDYDLTHEHLLKYEAAEE